METFTTKRNITVVFIVILFFILGVFVGIRHIPEIDKVASVSNRATVVETQADFSPFWKTWNLINEKSPDAKNITDQDRVYGAISGLVSSLNDPYSVFFNPDESKSFQEEIAGNFSGVGMEVGMKNKVLTVIAPLKGTPAEKADIRTGDQILKINDKSTSGMDTDQAIKLIRGDKGTSVKITIFRVGLKQPKEITIVRDTINVPTLDSELRPDGIFLIKLYSFSANSASLFNQAIEKFINSGSSKLILDLRGNPGGYLESAVDISSWFLPSGQVVVTEDYGNGIKPKIFRSRGYNPFNDKLKFMILIDGGSASASEIVAGALRDRNGAKLIGEKTFGKGTVQDRQILSNGGALHVTIAKWLLPSGQWIHHEGIPVDIEVKDDPATADIDEALQKAIETL